LKTYTELTTTYFMQNGLVILGTIIGVVISGSIFLLAVDAIIRRNIIDLS